MYTIEVQYLDETIAQLEEIDREAAKRLVSRVRTVVQPTLSKARSYAGGVGAAPSGAYASSLSLKSYTHGVKFASSDPGGGVIEFANIGARILHGKRAGKQAPVPYGSGPPRALLKAILEDEESIVEDVNQEVIEMCDFQIGV